MNASIYDFSGTGNSLAVAKNIAGRSGGVRLVPLMLAVGLGACNKDLPPRSDPSYAECKAELEAATCQGSCKDGFGESLIYDRNSVKLDSSEMQALDFADSTRRKSLCSYYSRICKPCARAYRIRGVEVGCSEYHAYLRRLQADASIRLDTAYSGF